MIAFPRLVVAVVLGSTAIGCSFTPIAAAGKSPLSPFKPGLQTTALEVIFLRHPYELAALNEDLWREVDETAIDANVRQALAQNGFRVGVIAGPLPSALEKALAADISPAAKSGEPSVPSPAVGQLEIVPHVRKRMLHALAGQRAELLTSGLYDRLPLLVRDGKEVHGETYLKAQCVVAVRATPLGDHRVRVQLAPEVQYGDPRREIHSEDGMMRFDSARPKLAFDKMAIEVVLSPGQTILLGTRPELAGSVGHYFFTEPQAGQLEQKLVLVRFDGTQFDNLVIGEAGADR